MSAASRALNTNRDLLTPGDRRVGIFLLYSSLIFDYLRPQEFIPGLGAVPIAGLCIYGSALWGAFHIRKDVLKSPVVVVLLFGIIVGLSGIAAVNVNAYKVSTSYLFQVFPQCVAIYVLANTTARLNSLLTLWASIYALLAVITILGGGLGPGDFVSDPNDTSLALSMGLPFLVYLSHSKLISIRKKWLYRLAIAVVVVAIVSTGSRGGFVGLVGVGLGFWWLSRQRIKIALITAVMSVVVGGAVFSMLPEEYVEEIVSINDKEDDTRVERMRTWEIAWIMYKDNPVIGVGAGNFMFNAGIYQRKTSWWTGNEKSLHGRVTHSAYFQIMSELGTIGILLFGYVMFVLPLKLYARRNELLRAGLHETDDFLHFQILMIAMGAFLMAGAFISVSYYPHLPNWVAMYAVVDREARKNAEKRRRLLVEPDS